jgi:hypothetical protein
LLPESQFRSNRIGGVGPCRELQRRFIEPFRHRLGVRECSRHASHLGFVDEHPHKVQLNDVLHSSLDTNATSSTFQKMGLTANEAGALETKGSAEHLAGTKAVSKSTT